MLRYIQTLTKPSQATVSALVLSGILISTGASLWQAMSLPAYGVEPTATVTKQDDRLPSRVANRVRRDLAQRFGIPRRDLQIVSSSRETWTDSCLGLGGPAELCALVTVEGWRVGVSNGQQTWFYRTDNTAEVLRLEEENTPVTELTPDVRDRILQTAARDAKVPVSQLQLVAAEPKVWDGCFGFDPGPEGACTEIAIFGWQAIVANNQRAWVYHTDQEGIDIRLNEAASQPSRAGAVIPSFIPQDQLPPNLSSEEVFREVRSGGFAGQIIETILMRDGRILRLERRGDRPTAPVLVKRVSPQQAEQFARQISQLKFLNFTGLDYGAPEGSADFITVALTGWSGTTQYDDMVSDQLPPNLQQIQQAWNQLIAS
jgi:hypothetical protein